MAASLEPGSYGALQGVSRPVGGLRAARSTLALGATIGNLLSVTPTVTVTFGVFLVPVAQEFGWSRTAAAGAFAALSFANAAMYPLAGRLADRFGCRPVLVLGYALLGLSILALAYLPAQPLLFYALFALTGAIGALPSSMILCKLLSEWFDEDRGFWMGLTGGIGNGLGATIMPAVAVALMARYGWRGGFTGIGLLVLLVGVPSAWLTLRSPRARLAGSPDVIHAGLSFRAALRTPLFWVILTTVPVGAGALTAVFANTMPMLISRGLTQAQASGVIAVFALICTVWEPLVGFLLDRRDRPAVAAPCYFVAAIGLVLLARADTLPMLLLAGLLTGIGLGSEFSVMPFLLSRYFGLKELGAISGVAYAVVLSTTALAPILLNLVYDRTGSYAPGLYVVAALLVCTSVIFLLLRRYPEWPAEA